MFSTTPSTRCLVIRAILAAKTAIKAAKMARMTKQRVLGVVENMAYYVCPDCGSRHYIFGRGGAFEIARLMDTRLLGRIPLDEATRQGGDVGSPAVLDPSTPVGAAFADIARMVVDPEAQPVVTAIDDDKP